MNSNHRWHIIVAAVLLLLLAAIIYLWLVWPILMR
jgi:hypothetical protein